MSSAATKSPWKTDQLPPGEPLSLQDLMSEELAIELQQQEEAQLGYELTNSMSVPPSTSDEPKSSVEECCSDAYLARCLQDEFDREHDKMLSKESAKYNGNSKVTISFDNYRSPAADFVDLCEDSSSDSEDDDVREVRHAKLDVSKTPTFGPTGVIKQADGQIITKHDKSVCGRKNTDKLMKFPPEFLTGDGAELDMQLPNNVYNKLKLHSLSEEKKMNRVHEKKDKSTAEMAVDTNTRLILHKMINCGMLESVNGIISTGKEAAVFYAVGGCIEGESVGEVALKVFKTTLNEFKNRGDYVQDDYRFKNPRKILKIWAEKEMLNLNRMCRSNIPCPKVVKLKKHVLCMSFIGRDRVPAPKLKDAQLSDEDLKLAYDQCVDALRRMYTDCKLVHADFSEFNVLWYNHQAFIIDVSQSMDLSHPYALGYLARDVVNLCQFFEKRAVPDVLNARQLFNSITGLSMKEDGKSEFLNEVNTFCQQETHLQDVKDRSHPADCQFRKAVEEQQGSRH